MHVWWENCTGQYISVLGGKTSSPGTNLNQYSLNKNKCFSSFSYSHSSKNTTVSMLKCFLGNHKCQANHYMAVFFYIRLQLCCHSVESPGMVDPQWDIWYWGSKWNLLTVCWSAVGCEWGTTFVYFGINYVCFIPSKLPVFAVEPQYLLQDFFLFLSKVSFEGHIQNLQIINVGLKFEWGL